MDTANSVIVSVIYFPPEESPFVKSVNYIWKFASSVLCVISYTCACILQYCVDSEFWRWYQYLHVLNIQSLKIVWPEIKIFKSIFHLLCHVWYKLCFHLYLVHERFFLKILLHTLYIPTMIFSYLLITFNYPFLNDFGFKSTCTITWNWIKMGFFVPLMMHLETTNTMIAICNYSYQGMFPVILIKLKYLHIYW